MFLRSLIMHCVIRLSVCCCSCWDFYLQCLVWSLLEIFYLLSFLLLIQFNRDSSQVWRKVCWFIYIIIFFSFFLIFFFCIFFFFCARFSSYPGPEICVRSSSELELRVSSCFSCYYIVFSCRLSSLALVVFVLVYLYIFFFLWKLGVY